MGMHRARTPQAMTRVPMKAGTPNQLYEWSVPARGRIVYAGSPCSPRGICTAHRRHMVPHSSGREELLRTPQRQCSLYLTASCADLRVATAGAEGGALVIAGAEPPQNFWALLTCEFTRFTYEISMKEEEMRRARTADT